MPPIGVWKDQTYVGEREDINEGYGSDAHADASVDLPETSNEGTVPVSESGYS